jgi:hypothetical protein
MKDIIQLQIHLFMFPHLVEEKQEEIVYNNINTIIPHLFKEEVWAL